MSMKAKTTSKIGTPIERRILYLSLIFRFNSHLLTAQSKTSKKGIATIKNMMA